MSRYWSCFDLPRMTISRYHRNKRVAALVATAQAMQ